MKKALMLIIIVLVFSGCSSTTDVNVTASGETNTNSINERAVSTEVSGPTGTEKSNTDKVDEKVLNSAAGNHELIDITISSILRISDKKDKNGNFLPTYTEASVICSLDKKPEKESLITLLPIGVDINSFNVPISRIEENSEEINENSKITWFNVYIDGIKHDNVLKLQPSQEDRLNEIPFDVCCIYPAMENVRVMDINKTDIGNFPKQDIKNILCIIDTNSDDNPDIIIVEEKTDYTIKKYYTKVNKSWKLFKQENPM